MKQIIVIGLGTFGTIVTKKLFENGQEVLAVDIDQKKVDDMMEYATQTLQADAADEDVLRSLGVRNFDAVIVTVSEDIQTSVLISMMCKEMGAKMVAARAKSELHARLLTRIGVDKVILPEQETADRLAHTLISSSVLDLIEISDEYSIVEIIAPEIWCGKTLMEINMIRNYGLLAIAIRRGGDFHIAPKADDEIRKGDVVSVVGSNENIHRFEIRFGAEIRPSHLK